MLYAITELRKERLQGRQGYALSVPELRVDPGEKILITGPSGSGKSTLLDMLGMALKPDRAGEFLFSPAGSRPVDVAANWRTGRLETLAQARRRVGYVLQTGALLPFLRVRDNILTPRRMLGLPDGDVAETLAQELGIAPLLGKYPARLSVGERQRAAIARALAAEPPAILADEPTAALDPANAAAVFALFIRLAEQSGAALVLVTHAPEQVEGKGFRRLRVTVSPRSSATMTEAVLAP